MCNSEILSQIPSQVLAVLQEIGQLANEACLPAYVVGGLVRDFLLNRENLDFDVVVEGDVISLAHRLSKRWDSKMRVHHSFGTGTLIRSDGLKIDFVSARCETYVRPGALPLVKFGTIVNDLHRRDFSINALAMSLNPDDFGELVDCTNGLRDLQTGLIRALHDRSFIDDPTRIFRAIRYEGRYRFKIVDSDQKRIRDAINEGILDLISGQRIRNEIDRILSEESAPKMIQRMCEFNLFRGIHPEWELRQDFDARWDTARQAINWAKKHLPNDSIDKKSLFWIALLTELFSAPREVQQGEEKLGFAEAIESVKGRLSLENRLYKKLTGKRQLGDALATLSENSRPSEVYRLLKSYPLEALVFSIVEPDQPQWRAEKIKNYLTHLRFAQPLIDGTDLIQLDLNPGPTFAEILWTTFAAQLDGKIQSKPEAYKFLGRIDETRSS